MKGFIFNSIQKTTDKTVVMRSQHSTEFHWGHHRRFNAYTEHIRKVFDARVQKLSLNVGFTCPNRDGTVSKGGCSFCDSDAFNPSYCLPEKSVTQQLLEGIGFHKKRYKRSSKYLAYFQAYSNTYAAVRKLEELYTEALGVPDIIGLVIGTRPDCIDTEKLDLLSQLAENSYIMVEYGVESCNNKTLQAINRGHTFEQAVWALEETRKRGLKTGAHFIIGLPGESRDEILSQTQCIARLPIDNVKFHQLQILKNTVFEKEYLQTPEKFELFECEEFVDFMIRYMEHLPPQIVIERFTAEVPPRYRIAPDWGNLRTDQILKMIEERLEEWDTWQGKRFLADSCKIANDENP